MKKGLIIMALAFFGITNAQKGSLLVAGNFGYDNIKTSNVSGDTNNGTFTFAPKIGYQFTDHLTVGIESSIANTTGTITPAGLSSTDTKTSILNLGAFLRYSQSLGGAFSVYGDLGAGMLSGKTTSTGTADVTNKGFYTALTPAVAIDLKKGFCLNFSIGGLGYKSSKDNAPNVTTTNNFYFNFGQQPTIGISKNF